MALNDFKDTTQGGGVLTVSNSNIGNGIKWNPITKKYEVDIIDLTPINNSINDLYTQINLIKSKPDTDTIYDDSNLRNKLTLLEGSIESLKNSISGINTNTDNSMSSLKSFKVPLRVSSNTNVDRLSTSYSVSHTINENINNIQAIECIGIITGGSNIHGVSVEIPLNIINRGGTSIFVQGSGGFSVDSGGAVRDRYNAGYAIINLYLK